MTEGNGSTGSRPAGWRGRLRLQGWRLWALLAVLAYTLVGFLLLPWVARDQAPKLAEKHLGVDLALEKVRFNPYLFKLTVEGLAVDDPESGPMLAFQRLVVDFSLSSTWRRAWTFSELTLEQPDLRLHRGADGIGNIERVLDRLPPPETPAEPEPEPGDAPPRLVLHNVSLVEGRLTIEDDAHPEDWSLSLGPLSFVMENFATLPEREGLYSLEATGPRGGKIRWSGTFAVGPLASEGEIDVDNLALAPFWEYVRHDFDAELTGDARLGLGFDYALDGGGAELDFRLAQGRARLTGLEVARRSSGEALLGLPDTRADAVEFDLADGTFSIGTVDLAQPEIELRRLEDGRIDLVAVLMPADDGVDVSADADAGADADADADADTVTDTSADAETDDVAETAPGLAIEVGAFRIDGGRVAFEDRAAPRPVRVALQDIGLALTDYRSAEGHRADLSLDATAASGGTLSLSGAVRAAPLDVGLDLGVEALSLLPGLPYMDEAMNLEVRSLLAAAEGRITITDAEPFGYAGRASLRALDSRLPGKDEQLIGWQTLEAEGVDLSLAEQSVRIGNVALSEPFLRVLVNEDGELNLTAIVRDSENGETAQSETGAQAETGAETEAGTSQSTEAAAAQADATGSGEAFAIGVGRVEITAATMDFTDLNLPIPFTALVKPMAGSVSAITSGSPTPARVELDGDVNQDGAATVRGQLNVFAPKQLMDLELDFRNIDMPNLTPYTVKFAGREIADGSLDVDLSWSIRDGQLEATNRMVINDLKLGEKVDAPGALDLPLDLAVALLTDAQGRIDLEVPVSGDLDDPEFRYAPLVFKALGNVLGKIVTAPFRFLASLLGGDGAEVDLEFVGFLAGDADLRGPEAAELAQLAEALTQRPELMLQVGAAYDEQRDGRIMRQRQLDAAISARFEAGEGSDKEGDPVRLIMESMYTEAQGAEALQALQAQHTTTPENSDAPVLDEADYIEALRAALLEQQQIEQQEFRLLGMERAAAVRNELVEDGGLDPARISVAEPGEAPRADDNLVFLKLELGVGE